MRDLAQKVFFSIRIFFSFPFHSYLFDCILFRLLSHSRYKMPLLIVIIILENNYLLCYLSCSRVLESENFFILISNFALISIESNHSFVFFFVPSLHFPITMSENLNFKFSYAQKNKMS